MKARFFFVIFASFLLLTLFMNKSISEYLQQKYHLYFFPQNELLSEANALKSKLEAIKEIFMKDDFRDKNLEKSPHKNGENLHINSQNLSKNSQKISFDKNATQPNDISKDKNLSKNDEKKASRNLNLRESLNALNKDKNDTNATQTAPLNAKNEGEFLFIGDSMMQSVGLALSKDLRALGIRSKNLAKQSTGLAYKSNFNWAKQLESALNANPKIRYLAVLLGANDTWDIKTRDNYYKFFSDKWQEFYGERVDELLKIAQSYGVRVFWYEVPAVKKDDLNEKIQSLNELFEEKIHENDEIFVRVGASLGLKAGEYSAYIRGENNKSLKVRADDGVHFNPRGAKIMSKLLLSHLKRLYDE